MKASADLPPLAPDANARVGPCGGGDGARGGDSDGGDDAGGNSGGGEASISEGEGGLVSYGPSPGGGLQRRSQQSPEAEAEAAPIITTEWLSQPAARGAPMVGVSK